MAFLSHQCKRLDKTSNCVTLLPYFYIISIPLACNYSNTARYICERFRTLSKIIKSYKIPCFSFLLKQLTRTFSAFYVTRLLQDKFATYHKWKLLRSFRIYFTEFLCVSLRYISKLVSVPIRLFLKDPFLS